MNCTLNGGMSQQGISKTKPKTKAIFTAKTPSPPRKTKQ
jgi:hypothetical protein